jgi:hypothetical protein
VGSFIVWILQYRLVFHLGGGEVCHVDRTYSRKETENRRLIVAAVNSFIRYWRNEEIEHAGEGESESSGSLH